MNKGPQTDKDKPYLIQTRRHVTFPEPFTIPKPNRSPFTGPNHNIREP